MSVLGSPRVAAVAAWLMQTAMSLGITVINRRNKTVFAELPGITHDITIPTSIAPARAVVYRPADQDPNPPVYVNFHGGGYVMRGVEQDDPLCRYLAAEAGVVVVNVDYAVAPQHRFPAPPEQAFEVVKWVAEHGAEHGWDGSRLVVGGQSAGGGIAAAAARQALERGGPSIALQVVHYAPLDLTVSVRHKTSPIDKTVLRPWMGDIFDNAYVPDEAMRADRLASPAGPLDTADLTGIAPALVITPENDRLHAEGVRYAQRLRQVGALLEQRDVPDADHAYDMGDADKAREIYALIVHHVKQTTQTAE